MKDFQTFCGEESKRKINNPQQLIIFKGYKIF
jgi:hypothetical protein